MSDYKLTPASSCLMTTKWGWSTSSVSNKWSTPVQIYRLIRQPAFSEDNLTYDNGFGLTVTRNKVRGTGRALSIRFECSERNKNFDLLGWGAHFIVNSDA